MRWRGSTGTNTAREPNAHKRVPQARQTANRPSGPARDRFQRPTPHTMASSKASPIFRRAAAFLQEWCVDFLNTNAAILKAEGVEASSE
jgi:hypothetical protein